jgi:hypothetical protein
MEFRFWQDSRDSTGWIEEGLSEFCGTFSIWKLTSALIITIGRARLIGLRKPCSLHEPWKWKSRFSGARFSSITSLEYGVRCSSIHCILLLSHSPIQEHLCACGADRLDAFWETFGAKRAVKAIWNEENCSSMLW